MKVDLTSYGLTADDWGGIRYEGYASLYKYYDDVPQYSTCEVSYNGERMVLARYPNKEAYIL